MANIIYNAGLKDLLSSAAAWDSSASYRALLVRDTSTYTPNKDHASLGAMTGLVEISVPSYTRQVVGGRTLAIDAANDEVVLDCNDVAFGNLETGQTVKAIIFYRHVSDVDPNQNIPLFWVDTDSTGLLPRALGGGPFTIQIDPNGLFRFKQL